MILSRTTCRKILWREFRVAILCGGTLALCNFAKLIFLDGITPPVAAVVCLTLICTVILSQLIGGLLPVIAEKLNFDPAVMASPAYHDHCRYHDTARLLQHRAGVAENLNFRHRVQYCKLYRTRLVWYNFF